MWETHGDVNEVVQQVHAVRATVYRWRSRYETCIEDALHSRIQGRSDGKASLEVLSTTEAIVREDPPPYHSWVSVIERLWKAIHDSTPRNQCCRSMYELCRFVPRFLEIVLPFSSNGHRVAHLRPAI